MKKIAMMLAAGFAIGMLTGCGIPEDEHNMMIAELESKHTAEVDKLNGEMADRDSVIKAEKAKVRAARIELDDATERIKGLQQKSAESTKALATSKTQVADLESALKTSKSQVAMAQEQAMTAENKFNTLDIEYQELKRRFEMYKKNMGSMGSSATSAPATTESAPAEEAPKSDAQKASSMLDSMLSM